jgi:hypothetical protein
MLLTLAVLLALQKEAACGELPMKRAVAFRS